MILTRLRGLYRSLSNTEKRVADYLLERPDDVIHYSITELAHFADVSETTVYRVVRKLEFNGYQEFKINLARELAIPRPIVSKALSIDSKVEDVLSKVVNDDIQAIRDTAEVLKSEDVKRVADRMLHSKRVVFFGVGNSGKIAEEAAARFARTGIYTNAYIDPYMQVIVGSMLDEDDMAIAISHSGTIRDTVKSLQVAKDAGAFTASITSGMNSPIVHASDIVLYSSTRPAPYMEEFTSSRIPEMLVLDVLFTVVTLEAYKEHPDMFHKIDKVLKPKRYL
ncbi:MAG: MurR/RpiR family transcriptional regulator [Thermotogae bacterium]|nr:MurR/RpiR family transcriptional regulator [Thermotogota bacterium]